MFSSVSLCSVFTKNTVSICVKTDTLSRYRFLFKLYISFLVSKNFFDFRYFLVVLFQNSWLRVKLIYLTKLYLEKYVGWLDSLARLKNFYTGQLRQSRQPLGAPYGGLDYLSARCRYKPTGQRNSCVFGCQAQLIKAHCSASSKTCAAVLEKTVFSFSIPIEIPDTGETAFAVVEISGQFLTTKKLSDEFCQGPGTQKLI